MIRGRYESAEEKLPQEKVGKDRPVKDSQDLPCRANGPGVSLVVVLKRCCLFDQCFFKPETTTLRC